ncbi:putative transcription factor WD40-like family [Arabidopsis thaliana]
MDGGGGIGELVPTKDSDDVLEEVTLVNDVDLADNSSNGFVIDRHRNRLLLAVGDLLGNRYSALVAYDLSTWSHLFLTVLSSHKITYADDVAVDTQGNAYVSDAKGGKIWIVDVNGKLVYTIRSPLFTSPVTIIDVSGGNLRFGDGLEFLSPTKISKSKTQYGLLRELGISIWEF